MADSTRWFRIAPAPTTGGSGNVKVSAAARIAARYQEANETMKRLRKLFFDVWPYAAMAGTLILGGVALWSLNLLFYGFGFAP